MTQLLPRALAATLLALLGVAILSLIAVLVLVGFPTDPAKLSSFVVRSAPYVSTIDLIVGGIVLFACGWWAGRPFDRSAAIRAGLIVAVAYIVIELAIVALRSGLPLVDWRASLISYAVKIAAAVLGAMIASRPSAPTVH